MSSSPSRRVGVLYSSTYGSNLQTRVRRSRWARRRTPVKVLGGHVDDDDLREGGELEGGRPLSRDMDRRSNPTTEDAPGDPLGFVVWVGVGVFRYKGPVSWDRNGSTDLTCGVRDQKAMSSRPSVSTHLCL